MASFLDKLKIKTALDNHVGLDLSCQHVSTANFMQMNVAWAKELVPKEKISVNMETFTRLAPMPAPTFGRGRINNRAFFVPFRTIFPAWNDFITDTVHVYANNAGSGLVSSVPTVGNLELLNTVLIDAEITTGNPDVVLYLVDSSDNNSIMAEHKIKLGPKGRQFQKVVESLGYKIQYYAIMSSQYKDMPFVGLPMAEQNSMMNAANSNNFGLYSALPLMAYLKVYHDWYFPSAYNNLEISEKMEKLFKLDSPTSARIDSRTLVEIFEVTHYVNYDSDYFVSAWDNPTNPTNGTYSNFVLVDPSGAQTGANSRYVVSGNTNNLANLPGGAPYLSNNSGNSLNFLSQWAVDALKSMTDYMKRHQLVGARALDRYLARFGVNLTAEKLNRSIYIGSQSQDLKIGDIMATADTSTASLGDYAGKGISFGNGNFEFETDEYGVMIIISSIIPQTGYVEGIDRNVMHITKLDYYTPEFDNLGTQAIAKTELYVPQNVTTYTGLGQSAVNQSFAYFTPKNNDVFGWTPRYAEYKIGKDRLTGDFRCNSINEGQNAWHLFREFKDVIDTAYLVHDINFMQGKDSGQYSRIFYNTDAEVADKFNVIYNFGVKSWSPMKSLFDTYEFDSHGKEVVEDVNGVKMN